MRLLLAALLAVMLAACGATVDGDKAGDQSISALPPVPTLPELRTGEGLAGGPLQRLPIPPDGNVRVAILLPFTGTSGELARSMLNAAEMAVFEIADDKFVLMPFDTKNTPEGAVAAAEQAIRSGVQLILGPLFATSVEAVAPLARTAGVHVVSFSNSQSVAGDGVFIMGFVPQQQVEAIADFAVSKGLLRHAVLAPQDAYGSAVVDTLRAVLPTRNAALVRTHFYDPHKSDFSSDVKAVADYDQRRRALLEQRALLQRQQDEVSRQALRRLENRDTIGDVDFDAILLPAAGQTLRSLASLLTYYDVNRPAVRFLGLRNWDEIEKPQAEPALVGSWYAAPSPAERQRFHSRFKEAFGRPPERLASLAYDSTALAAILAQDGGEPRFSFEALTNPNGFLGVDGLFRLEPTGVAQRKFAILEIRKAGVQMIQAPPTSFAPAVN